MVFTHTIQTDGHTIETYGRRPHNINIWSHTIARRRPFVTPGRFFCLLWCLYYTHYLLLYRSPHCHSFAYSICNLHPCACLCCKQAGLLLLALRCPPCLSTGVLGSGPAFCCPPNWWHT